MPPRYDDDADLVRAATTGDSAAFVTLYQRWFDPCFDVARRIVRDEGRAAEVAQDVFLVAWQQIASLRDPSAFGGWVLRASRNKALNRLDKERRAASTDDASPVLAFHPATDNPEAQVSDDLAIAEHHDLVWAAASALGPRDVSVLDLHLRHGLEPSELADELGVTPNNAYQLLFRMKARLGGAIRAWVLYANGQPSCAWLRSDLAEASVIAFGAPAVKVIERHVEACADCANKQEAVLAPEAMFSAVPMLIAAPVIKEAVAATLASMGVPVGAATGATGSGGAMSSGPSSQEPSASTGRTSPEGLSPEGLSPKGGQVVPNQELDAHISGAPRRSRALAIGGCAAVLLLVGGGLLASRNGPADRSATLVASASLDGATSSTADSSPRSGTTGSSADGTGSTVATDIVASGITPPDGSASGAGSTSTSGGLSIDPSPPSTAPMPTTTATPDPTLPPPVDPTTTPPPPPPPPPPPLPVIVSFAVTTPPAPPGGPSCPTQWSFRFVWSTTDATGAVIDTTDGPPSVALPSSGTTVLCRLTPSPPPGGWTLIVSGPGGSVSQTK